MYELKHSSSFIRNILTSYQHTMRYFFLLSSLIFFNLSYGQTLVSLPIWNPANDQQMRRSDWLIEPQSAKATIYRTENNKDIILYNGLVKRTFRMAPDLACTGYKNLINGVELLRAVKPEGRLTIDGKDYNIGGLYGQKENAYLLPGWVDEMKSSDSSFHFVSFEITPIVPRLKWKTSMWTPNKNQPTGKKISFKFRSGLERLKDLDVFVNYELFDGLPLISKSVSILNNGSNIFKLERVVNEILGMVEEESGVVGSPEQMRKPEGIYVETNYAFNNAMRYDLSDQTSHWKADSSYTSQVNYNFQTPCLLEIYTPSAPGIDLQPGEVFNSVISYELLMGSYDRERRGMAVRKMYRTIAPWTTANPIFMHLVSKNDEQVRTAIDQCATTGYESLILSFGSHLNMEDTSADNIRRWKTLAGYAHDRKIFI
ncbi:MAG: hypothetical protein ABIO82_05325, partial [Ginsengibacter sp.]